MGERGIVLRVSATGSVGRALAARLGVRAVPTLVVYDAEGTEVLRQVGSLRQAEVMAALGFAD